MTLLSAELLKHSAVTTNIHKNLTLGSQSPPDWGPRVGSIFWVQLLHQALTQEPQSNSRAVTLTVSFVLLMAEIFWLWGGDCLAFHWKGTGVSKCSFGTEFGPRYKFPRGDTHEKLSFPPKCLLLIKVWIWVEIGANLLYLLAVECTKGTCAPINNQQWVQDGSLSCWKCHPGGTLSSARDLGCQGPSIKSASWWVYLLPPEQILSSF